MTAEELGKRVGVNRTYISKIENGFMLPSPHIALIIKKELKLGKNFLKAYYEETRPDIVAFFNNKAYSFEVKYNK